MSWSGVRNGIARTLDFLEGLDPGQVHERALFVDHPP